MSQWVVGLTGGIGVGKTTVTDLFNALGIDIIDADIAARQVVEPGTDALSSIAAHFGADILAQDGQLNRKALRDIVFNDDTQRQWLDQLLHPLIRQKMLDDVKHAQSLYCILVAPLLIENGLTELVDQVLVVDADETIQQHRAATRDGTSPAHIAKIMQQQVNRETRRKAADQIILNDGNKQELHEKVAQLHEFYLNQAKNMP